MILYLKNKRGTFNAIAEYREEEGLFTVLKGSLVTADISAAPTFRGAKAVAKRRKQSVVDQRVVKDVIFKSPSTAANFVTGRSSDGCSLWKNESGHSFKEVITGKQYDKDNEEKRS